MTEEVVISKMSQDSIEVSVNAKQQYTWKIKIYYDYILDADFDSVRDRIKYANDELKKEFG